MRTLLNIIWFLFGGLPLFLGYLLAGVVACFRIAGYVLWPFGKRVIDKPGVGAGSGLMNIVWFLVAGLWLAIGHITTAAAQAVTIVGIPLAIANLKMIPITCFPFGKAVIDDPTASIL